MLQEKLEVARLQILVILVLPSGGVHRKAREWARTKALVLRKLIVLSLWFVVLCPML